jgi:hypothetical protein
MLPVFTRFVAVMLSKIYEKYETFRKFTDENRNPLQAKETKLLNNPKKTLLYIREKIGWEPTFFLT